MMFPGVNVEGLEAYTAVSASTSPPLSFDERQELTELRKKLKRVEMERDILAKATAWFANNND